MRPLSEYINEASRNGIFVGLTSKRNDSSFSFAPGQKVIVMKYSTYHYIANPFGMAEVVKVNRKSVVIKGINSTVDSFKFDENGISVQKMKNTFPGAFTDYWVLYNAELAQEPDLQDLLKTGNNIWGFKLQGNDSRELLVKYIKELGTNE